MKLSELLLQGAEELKRHRYLTGNPQADLEVSVYETKEAPLSVKHAVVSLGVMRDGHGYVHSACAQWLLLP